jgi:hypothetical protein
LRCSQKAPDGLHHIRSAPPSNTLIQKHSKFHFSACLSARHSTCRKNDQSFTLTELAATVGSSDLLSSNKGKTRLDLLTILTRRRLARGVRIYVMSPPHEHFPWTTVVEAALPVGFVPLITSFLQETAHNRASLLVVGRALPHAYLYTISGVLSTKFCGHYRMLWSFFSNLSLLSRLNTIFGTTASKFQ